MFPTWTLHDQYHELFCFEIPNLVYNENILFTHVYYKIPENGHKILMYFKLSKYKFREYF